MVNNVVKELEAARSKVAELEKSLHKERISRLAGLPAEFGFDSAKDFLSAFKQASGSRKTKPKGKKAAAGAKKSSKRTKITPEIKASVKELVSAGKTGAEIASSLSISIPSVQNIKKELGLVKARG